MRMKGLKLSGLVDTSSVGSEHMEASHSTWLFFPWLNFFLHYYAIFFSLCIYYWSSPWVTRQLCLGPISWSVVILVRLGKCGEIWSGGTAAAGTVRVSVAAMIMVFPLVNGVLDRSQVPLTRLPSVVGFKMHNAFICANAKVGAFINLCPFLVLLAVQGGLWQEWLPLLGILHPSWSWVILVLAFLWSECPDRILWWWMCYSMLSITLTLWLLTFDHTSCRDRVIFFLTMHVFWGMGTFCDTGNGPM